MQIQTEFVKNQFAAIQEQMKDLCQGARQAATDFTPAAKRKT
jgi:hypothetical protein